MSTARADQIANGLARTGSPVLFAAAGDLLAESLVAGNETLPAMVGLADAMHRRMGEVQWAAADQSSQALRISVAAAAGVLGQARPRLADRVRRMIGLLLSDASPPQWTDDLSTLAHRTLLSLAIGDLDTTRRSVEVLRSRGHVLGPVLASWAAGQRVRGTEPSRAWDLLRALSRRLDDPVPASLLAVAAFALPTAEAVPWSPVAIRRAEVPSMG